MFTASPPSRTRIVRRKEMPQGSSAAPTSHRPRSSSPKRRGKNSKTGKSSTRRQVALGTKALQALQATCDELGVELPPERDESVVMEEESAISPPPSASLEFCASDDANASAAVESPRHEPDSIPNSEGDAELLLLNDRIETTTIERCRPPAALANLLRLGPFLML